MRSRRHEYSNAVARNVHPRLRLAVAGDPGNPYEALRLAHDAARLRNPRDGYRQFLRRLWQAAA